MSYEYEGVLKVITDLGQPSRQTIPRGTDAILCSVYGDHNGNVYYKYEGILKVISRSRATLIFSMGVPLVKPHGSQRTGFLLLGRPSLEVQTPSPAMFIGIIMGMCPANIRGF